MRSELYSEGITILKTKMVNDNKLELKKASNTYGLDQEVYVLTHNKLVITSVEGFKKNNLGNIEYSLTGFNSTIDEDEIYETPKDCFKFLGDNIATPESVTDRAKKGFAAVKNLLSKKL